MPRRRVRLGHASRAAAMSRRSDMLTAELCEKKGVDDIEVLTHKVYLAVESEVSLTLEKRGANDGSSSYNKDVPRNNIAVVPISMSRADQKVYPKIYEAFQSAMQSGARPELQIAFRSTEVPPIRKYPLIRLQVLKSEFLKRLHDDLRFQITVNIKGCLYRGTYRRGRPIFLTINHSMTALYVEEDGESADAVIRMQTDILDHNDLKGKFTLELKWFGPEPMYKPFYDGLEKMAPKDLTVSLCDGETSFECHSALLKLCSPVLEAMLNSNMIEGTTGQLTMNDVNEKGLESLLEFLYEGTIRGAFESAETCFELFALCHKYQISVLERATATILQEKPFEWLLKLPIAQAFELFLFSKSIPGLGKLFQRAKQLLKRRPEDLKNVERFQEVLKSESNVVQLIYEWETTDF